MAHQKKFDSKALQGIDKILKTRMMRGNKAKVRSTRLPGRRYPPAMHQRPATSGSTPQHIHHGGNQGGHGGGPGPGGPGPGSSGPDQYWDKIRDDLRYRNRENHGRGGGYYDLRERIPRASYYDDGGPPPPQPQLPPPPTQPPKSEEEQYWDRIRDDLRFGGRKIPKDAGEEGMTADQIREITNYMDRLNASNVDHVNFLMNNYKGDIAKLEQVLQDNAKFIPALDAIERNFFEQNMKHDKHYQDLADALGNFQGVNALAFTQLNQQLNQSVNQTLNQHFNSDNSKVMNALGKEIYPNVVGVPSRLDAMMELLREKNTPNDQLMIEANPKVDKQQQADITKSIQDQWEQTDDIRNPTKETGMNTMPLDTWWSNLKKEENDEKKFELKYEEKAPPRTPEPTPNPFPSHPKFKNKDEKKFDIPKYEPPQPPPGASLPIIDTSNSLEQMLERVIKKHLPPPVSIPNVPQSAEITPVQPPASLPRRKAKIIQPEVRPIPNSPARLPTALRRKPIEEEQEEEPIPPPPPPRINKALEKRAALAAAINLFRQYDKANQDMEDLIQQFSGRTTRPPPISMSMPYKIDVPTSMPKIDWQGGRPIMSKKDYKTHFLKDPKIIKDEMQKLFNSPQPKKEREPYVPNPEQYLTDTRAFKKLQDLRYGLPITRNIQPHMLSKHETKPLLRENSLFNQNKLYDTLKQDILHSFYETIGNKKIRLDQSARPALMDIAEDKSFLDKSLKLPKEWESENYPSRKKYSDDYDYNAPLMSDIIDRSELLHNITAPNLPEPIIIKPEPEPEPEFFDATEDEEQQVGGARRFYKKIPNRRKERGNFLEFVEMNDGGRCEYAPIDSVRHMMNDYETNSKIKFTLMNDIANAFLNSFFKPEFNRVSREVVPVHENIYSNYFKNKKLNTAMADEVEDKITYHTRNKLRSITPKRYSIKKLHDMAHRVPGLAINPDDDNVYVRALDGENLRMLPTGHHSDELIDIIKNKKSIKNHHVLDFIENLFDDGRYKTVFEMPSTLGNHVIRYRAKLY